MRLFQWLTAAALVALAPAAPADDLSKPAPVLFGKSQLDVEHSGHAAPFFGDFDGDGRKDLLVGEFYQGRLRIYHNVGRKASPKFEEYTTFKDGDRAGCIYAS
jgi:hypothetical protein